MFVGTVQGGGGNASRHMEASGDLQGEFAGFGYVPVPGTLNLHVDGFALQQFDGWPKWRQRRGWDEPKFTPVWIGGVRGHVKRYGDVIEAVASVRLRDMLGLSDGDTVDVRFRPVLSGAIMAHEKRAVWAENLSAQTGFPIVWDRQSDVWDTARRAWLTVSDFATHHVVVQDDAVLAERFVEDLPFVLSHTPNNVPVSFCTVDYRMQAQRKLFEQAVAAGQPFFQSFHGLSGVAVACPARQVGKMVQFGDELTGNPHDDLKMMCYWRSKKQPIWFTVPSLADHRCDGNPSLLAGHDRFVNRSASTFDPSPPSSHVWTAPERKPMFNKPKAGDVTFVNVRTGKTQTVTEHSKAAVAFAASRSWSRVGGEPETFTPDDVMVPPKVGRGSARDGWAAYATLHSVTFNDDATRDQIVAACEQAGVA